MNILSSIYRYKCPKCRKGKLFTEPFNPKKALAMPKRCENCNQHFEPEPMFYYGAMYISYMLSSLIFLPLALVLVFAFDWTVLKAMLTVVAVGAILYFKVLRISRSIWIHLNVKFDENHR